MIVDRNILRYERTQYAKQIRKDYESGKIKERRCNLRKYAIRTDGLCNTISTVLKDNYLLERRIAEMSDTVSLPGAYGRNFGSKGKMQDADGECETLQAAMGCGGGNVPLVEQAIVDDTYKYNESEITDVAPTQITNCGRSASSATVLKVEGLRIRKLTPKECWRLMGFDDSDFEKADKVNSNTQLYKQAGNSIVVDVLVYLLKNIKELTYEEQI